MANTPYYTKAETDAISALLRRDYNYGNIQFQGSISAGTYATKPAGWYFATNTGDYIMGSTTIAVDVSDTLTIIIVPTVINDSSKVEIPVNITIDAVPTDGSTNAVQSNGVFDAIAAETTAREYATNIMTETLLTAADLTVSNGVLTQTDNDVFLRRNVGVSYAWADIVSDSVSYIVQSDTPFFVLAKDSSTSCLAITITTEPTYKGKLFRLTSSGATLIQTFTLGTYSFGDTIKAKKTGEVITIFANDVLIFTLDYSARVEVEWGTPVFGIATPSSSNILLSDLTEINLKTVKQTVIDLESQITTNTEDIALISEAVKEYETVEVDTLLDNIYYNSSTGASTANGDRETREYTVVSGKEYYATGANAVDVTALAVFFGFTDNFLGSQGIATIDIVQVYREKLILPSGTTKIAITNITGYNSRLETLEIVSTDLPFKGKKVVLYGDSITVDFASALYASQILAKTDCSFLTRRGISGGTFAVELQDVSRVATINSDNPDLVIIHCVNDHRGSKAIGDLSSAVGSATMIGGLKYIFNTLISHKKDVHIVICTPIIYASVGGGASSNEPNSLGLYVIDYVNAIKNLASTYGIPVVDLSTKCEFRASVEATADRIYTSDGVHPIELGYTKMTDEIARVVNSISF